MAMARHLERVKEVKEGRGWGGRDVAAVAAWRRLRREARRGPKVGRRPRRVSRGPWWKVDRGLASFLSVAPASLRPPLCAVSSTAILEILLFHRGAAGVNKSFDSREKTFTLRLALYFNIGRIKIA